MSTITNRENVEAIIKTIIRSICGVDEVNLEDSLEHDLHADELDIIEACMRIEDELEIIEACMRIGDALEFPETPHEVVSSFDTVQSIVDYMWGVVSKRP